jgi:hypothetical protein
MKNSLICVKYLLLISIIYSGPILSSPDWSENASLGTGKWAEYDRENVYQLNVDEFEQVIENGKVHAVEYPVTVTGMLFPYEGFKTAFQRIKQNQWWLRIFSKKISYNSMASFFKWAGFFSYPETAAENYSNIPLERIRDLELPMSATLIERHGTKGITFGCASCHAGNLFGKKVLGMSNRFPRANEIFIMGKRGMKTMPKHLGAWYLKLSAAEKKQLLELKEDIKWIDSRLPQAYGLDTSLAHVGLSLHLRAKDEWASKVPIKRRKKHPFKSVPADSKPLPWWNTKYKTRWLSDGSLVAGNPIHTNFLWNEIGRGVDIKVLDQWLRENPHIVKEMTAMVFASKAPRYEDFFPAERIDLESAQRGEMLYVSNCQKCHGKYEKAWNEDHPDDAKLIDLIQTIKVIYFAKTPVKDVGTDPYRYQGMNYFYRDLNRLKLSKKIKTVIKPQKGYVPPPLVGIWARWPYFHNNSVPTLCDVLTVESKRPKIYWAREANDPVLDFDQNCNGYPKSNLNEQGQALDQKYLFDTSLKGLSNRGHSQKILLDANGRPKFNHQDVMDLVMFMKTL